MESHSESQSVATKPVAAYVGGKRNLSKRIIERINAIPHELYAEPFVGMGGVFLRRDRAAKIEVINDISGDVATFFRVLQRHYNPLMDELRWRLTTRADFDRLLDTNPETLTDLERAARFLYLQRTSFGGKIAGQTFGTQRTGPARFNVTKLQPMLEAVHERLAGVVIERLPFQDFIPRYDREGALFYLDPPYYGCEDYYGAGVFARSDFERLAQLLGKIKGRFILSLNDVPAVWEIFDRFTIEAVSLNYRLSGGVTEASEVLISGGASNA
jgi:DNA adenine methylase